MFRAEPATETSLLVRRIGSQSQIYSDWALLGCGVPRMTLASRRKIELLFLRSRRVNHAWVIARLVFLVVTAARIRKSSRHSHETYVLIQ